MSAGKDRVLAGVPGPSKPPPPVVWLTVWRPGTPLPVPPMRGDRYDDSEDTHLGFHPAG